jgi:hypothetical protein
VVIRHLLSLSLHHERVTGIGQERGSLRSMQAFYPHQASQTLRGGAIAGHLRCFQSIACSAPAMESQQTDSSCWILVSAKSEPQLQSAKANLTQARPPLRKIQNNRNTDEKQLKARRARRFVLRYSQLHPYPLPYCQSDECKHSDSSPSSDP